MQQPPFQGVYLADAESRVQRYDLLASAYGGENECSVISPSGSGTPFRDVEPEAFYYDAVLWAAETGITLGTGDGQFSPQADCVRAQVVTFLYRAYGEK